VLTDAGRVLFTRALAVEERITEFELVLDGAAAAEDRSVTVAASEGVATYLLAPLSVGARVGPVGLMLERVPDLRLPPISLVSARGDEPADIDVIWTERGSAPSATAPNYRRRLATIRFRPFYSDAYRDRQGGLPDTFEKIAEHSIVTHSAACGRNQRRPPRDDPDLTRRARISNLTGS
jgi:DNA-binding transcriptional LysR family regulator